MARCGVCGLESGDAVCPRCNTILLPDLALCPKCGKPFDGWLALCDACEASLGSDAPADEEAVRLLASVPGISEDAARALVGRGFRDFSEVVRLALPEAAVRRGIHHAIARQALLADLAPTAAPAESGAACPTCGAPQPSDVDRCEVCGSGPTAERTMEAVEQQLQEVTDEFVALAQDEDVRGMPDDVRQELLDAFAGIDPEDVVREEYRRQLDAWREKGFVVAPLEDLLARDLEAFRQRSLRLIRAQTLKKVEGGAFRCPLCDVPLPPEAEVCENCGAKFV